MQVNQITTIIRRWIWLFIFLLLLGLLVAYGVTSFQTPMYRSTTKVMILLAGENDPQSIPNPRVLEDIISTYSELILTSSVLNDTREELNVSFNAGDVTIRPISNTRIFQVSVVDEDPNEAAITADGLVRNLIKQNSLLQNQNFNATARELASQIEQINNRISSIEEDINIVTNSSIDSQIRNIKSQIARLEILTSNSQREYLNFQAEVSPPLSAEQTPEPLTLENQTRLSELLATYETYKTDLTRYQQAFFDLTVRGQIEIHSPENALQIDQLQTQLGLYQDIYANLLSEFESARLSNLDQTPGLALIEPAKVTSNPISPNWPTNMILGGSVGLLLALLIAFLFEYFDDSLRSVQDVQTLLNMPILGQLGTMTASSNKVHAVETPRSIFSESLRKLRTNIQFSQVDEEVRTIMLTSANPRAGKTTISTNLAAVIAQAGQSVILVDADLRRPIVHRAAGVPNNVGLTNVLVDKLPLEEAFVEIDGMTILPSGPIPPNPSELINSERMGIILDELKQLADFIIIDCPPFVVADPLILSKKVDGVLLVVRHKKTKRSAAKSMLDALKQVDVKVLGVVINDIKQSSSDGYYYYYDSSYYVDKPEKKRFGRKERNTKVAVET